MFKFNKKRAFTLLEMLLVIAIIAILAGIVIIAINPARQLAQARNAQRQSDLRAIYNATQQYYIDNQTWPTTTMPTTLTEICDGDGLSSNNDFNCLNLSVLVPTYLSSIPTDPLTSVGTNYQISINSNTQTPELTAPSSTEYDLIPVQVGTTTGITGSNNFQMPTNGLVAYWPLNGDADDYSVNSNNGTIYGATSTTGVNGLLNNAYSFDGNDYISLSVNNLPTGYSERTVCAWVKTNTNTGFHWAFGYGGYGIGYSFALGQNANHLGVTGYGMDIWDIDSVVIGEWSHLCASYDGAIGYLYINGTLRNSLARSWNTGASAAYIGRQVPVTEYLNGSVDEIRVYNRALDPSEISSIYNLEKN